MQKEINDALQLTQDCTNPDMCAMREETDAAYLKERNKEEEEETDEDDEFTCETCSTVQGKNNCELCDVEDVCEECHGQGGDYGPNEIWVCHECLPICLECEAPLYSSCDKCCGKGRSDDEEEEEEFGMGTEEVVALIKEEEDEEDILNAEALSEMDAADALEYKEFEEAVKEILQKT